MEKYIEDFVREIYQDYTEFALSFNSEKECLIDATELIRSLRNTMKRARLALVQFMNGELVNDINLIDDMDNLISIKMKPQGVKQ